MEASHIPVLLNEALEFLEPESGGIYVDGTLGMGGHTSEILKRSYPDGRVIGIDRDTEALKIASVRLQEFGDRVSDARELFRNGEDRSRAWNQRG